MPIVKVLSPVVGNGSKSVVDGKIVVNAYRPLVIDVFRSINFRDITSVADSRYSRLKFMLCLIELGEARLTALRADPRFLVLREKTRAEVKAWILSHVTQAEADQLIDGKTADQIESGLVSYCRAV